jgi:hypothetical protein
MASTNTSPAITYCGTYTSQVAGQENGIFNIVIGGITVAGVSISTTGQDLRQLDGTISGASINIPGVAVGALSGTSVSGSFDVGANRGVWSGNVCQ